ncbi:MAG: YggS family pyridoxal phosphate-dependent enzyme [Planctomycetaceae bacterium]
MQVAANLADVNDRIAAACLRAGRIATDVTVVAVTKYAETEWVRELVAEGVRDLGESRPQQLVERAGAFGEYVRWHLIGHLQRNKARKVLPIAVLIHSVDTMRLLETLERLAEETETSPRVLLEVNISGEAAKHGFSPQELAANWDAVLACQRVCVDGLMTMAPAGDSPEDARPCFRRLRDLRDELRDRSPKTLSLPELSMGMSGDYEVAVEEGATLVRIGSRLFEGLRDGYGTLDQ